MALKRRLQLQRMFRSQTNGIKMLRLGINSQTMDEKFIDKELMELLTYHPEANEKGVVHISDIEYLVVRPHKLFKSPTLHYKSILNSEEDDISAKMCIRSLFGNYKEPTYHQKLCRATRGAIAHGTRLDFLNKHKNSKCSNCSAVSQAVDHYPLPFSKIMENFVNGRTLEIEYNGYDYELKTPGPWKEYHDKHASYRMLCHSCNSKFGNYS